VITYDDYESLKSLCAGVLRTRNQMVWLWISNLLVKVSQTVHPKSNVAHSDKLRRVNTDTFSFYLIWYTGERLIPLDINTN